MKTSARIAAPSATTAGVTRGLGRQCATDGSRGGRFHQTVWDVPRHPMRNKLVGSGSGIIFAEQSKKARITNSRFVSQTGATTC